MTELAFEKDPTERFRSVVLQYEKRALRVEVNLGRGKRTDGIATVTGCYPRLFALRVERRRGRVETQTFTYTDLMTGVVSLYDPDSGERLEFSYEAPAERKADGYDLLY